eukprot:15330847-Ditylum_brightwellii.AAC.2
MMASLTLNTHQKHGIAEQCCHGTFKAKVDKKKVAGKRGKKKDEKTKKEEKVESAAEKVSSVASAASDKLLIANAKKSLEVKTISYPQNLHKVNMDSSLFFILQQQMKQREDKKTMREQQMLLAHMDFKASEHARKEHESQRERHHQDFMMMTMVTGAKSPSSFISLPSPSTSPSSFIMPTKGDEAKKKW